MSKSRLTPERIHQIQGIIGRSRETVTSDHQELYWSARDLLAEVDRLRAENEELREAGEGLASFFGTVTIKPSDLSALAERRDEALARWRDAVEGSPHEAWVMYGE